MPPKKATYPKGKATPPGQNIKKAASKKVNHSSLSKLLSMKNQADYPFHLARSQSSSLILSCCCCGGGGIIIITGPSW
jgi:hypothetical protein